MDGINPKIWGPNMWWILHLISTTYPHNPTPEEKQTYYNFVHNFGAVLPCIVCRDNFRNNLQQMQFSPAHLMNRTTFTKFIFDLHNLVNIETGKKPNTDFDKTMAQFEAYKYV